MDLIEESKRVINSLVQHSQTDNHAQSVFQIFALSLKESQVTYF